MRLVPESAPDYSRLMSHRILPRCLLSLLLVWQLLASALAHPLQLPQRADDSAVSHAMRVSAAAMEDCPQHHQAMMQDEVAGETAGMAAADADDLARHSCKSACKCPCPGTPALMAVLPALEASPPQSFLLLPQPAAPLLSVSARLLRPPIA